MIWGGFMDSFFYIFVQTPDHALELELESVLIKNIFHI